MDVRRYSLSWSYAYIYCILTLLCGDGLAVLYYNDRRGQPELQQAMDNAPLPPTKNFLPFPSEHDQDVPLLLTEKTSALLSEALHMLQKIKDTKERKWFEAFVRRLGSLATPLEEDKSVKTANEVQGAVLQQLDFIHHTVPSSSSTAVARKFYKVQPKHQVPSAQVDAVLPVSEENINRVVVRNPSLVFGMRQDNNDDLVMQLHNQDRRIKSKSSIGVPVTYYDARLLDSTVTTQAMTPPTSTNGKSKPENIVQAQIEVRKPKKEPEKDVRSFFKQINSQRFSDFTNMDFVQGQKHNILESEDEAVLAKDEAAVADDPEESEELPNSTASPSRLQVTEATHDGIAKEQLHEPMKYFLFAEPTMSDEMERELRAGKIVVLSHSLVRTNFKSKHGNKKEGSITQSVSSSPIPEGGAV